MVLLRRCMLFCLVSLCIGCNENEPSGNTQASDVSQPDTSATSVGDSDVTETDTAWDRWK